MNVLQQLHNFHHSDLEETTDGAFTLKENSKYIHSTRSPLREAERLIENINYPVKGTVIILWGTGLGYHVEMLLNKGYQIIAVETRPKTKEIFQQIFPISKLVGFIESEETNIFDTITGLPIETANKFIDIVMRGMEIPPHMFELAEQAKNAMRSTHRIQSFLIDSWYNNILVNLSMIDCRRIGISFTSIFHNQEIIICSAGPSLKESLPFIKKLQNQCIILSVDTALTSLLEYGIIPDYVHAVDAKIHNINDFNSISDDVFSQMTLIADITLSPQIVRLPWKRILFTCTVQPICEENSSLYKRIKLLKYLWEHGIRFPELQTGGSVANSAFHAGIYFGAAKVTLAGQDLAYSNHRGHSTGSPYDYTYRLETNRLNSLDTIHIKKVPFDSPVKAIGNTITFSDPLLIQFRKWFEHSLKQNPKLHHILLNASEQGAYFEGWNHKSLAEYIPSSQKFDIPVVFEAYDFISISAVIRSLFDEELLPNSSNIIIREYFYKEQEKCEDHKLLARKIKRFQKILEKYYDCPNNTSYLSNSSI
ncbi:MAG: motility associated factor glycosyltransferase family protein [Brevinemataceae bacterium]